MDRFHAMLDFREVARCGGFAAAARKLNTSPPSVSRLVGDLEDDLGVRLFNRSTRKVSLTEEGELYLHKAVSLLDELLVVSDDIRNRQREPRGFLRISSVVAFGQERVARAVPGFMRLNPAVEVALELTNRKVDLIEERFDLAIRVGAPEGLDPSSLMARKISEQRLHFVATPGYVHRFGNPATLDALIDHTVCKHVSGNWGRSNVFLSRGKEVTHALSERFVVNSPNAVLNAVLSGEAIGLLGDFMVGDLIAEGKLVRILPEYETRHQPIFAVFVHRTYMPAKVRAFLDHLVSDLAKRNGVDGDDPD